MKDLLISLDSNILKVSYCSPEGCAGFSQELPSNLVQDSKILNIEEFTEKLIELSSSLLPIKNKPDALTFLIGPQDVILSFLTISKGENSVEERLVEATVSKIETPLENLYFSYNKIAPFVYQFVGIKKEFLDSFLEISSLWGVPIKSVVPWVLLLPKTLEDTSPAIFIGTFEDKHIVVLSELNGVYFASSYEKEKTDKELSDLVKKLSLYNRSTPIKNIYTVNSAFTIGGQYQVHPILSEDSYFEEESFEMHDIVLKVIKGSPDLLSSHVNMLNLLPLPEVRSNKALVPVSAGMAVLVALVIGGYFIFVRGDSTPPVVPSEVLSGSDVTLEVPESTPSASPEVEKETPPNGKVYTLKDMIIRVENATEVNGAAGRTKEFLESQDLTVESIGTAPNQLELTQVLITPDLMDLKEELKEVLGKNIPMGVVDTLEKLDSSDEEYSHNVLIRLGKDSSI
ncbi:MAG TPA: LytR family transcriptional regulator [candidate division WWE3 bacterium]|uniref:LytR family transcriptional regulator n=1 Tax=candidate division WWE3 bacterium TaxID=2053526 RepID=A0A7C1HIY9_UNCKA|nr:LytR family transcriptional regulator [candidate division WWE3 bacterium]